jgi:hypothetical protein
MGDMKALTEEMRNNYYSIRKFPNLFLQVHIQCFVELSSCEKNRVLFYTVENLWWQLLVFYACRIQYWRNNIFRIQYQVYLG